MKRSNCELLGRVTRLSWRGSAVAQRGTGEVAVRRIFQSSRWAASISASYWPQWFAAAVGARRDVMPAKLDPQRPHAQPLQRGERRRARRGVQQQRGSLEISHL